MKLKNFMALFAGVLLLTAVTASWAEDKKAPATADSMLGINITSLRMTAAGHMLDLRYKVTDEKMAAAFLNAGTRPFLVHDGTGTVLGVPALEKVGRLQQTRNPPTEGITYFMFFENLLNAVKKGDTLTLVIGDTYIEGLRVN